MASTRIPGLLDFGGGYAHRLRGGLRFEVFKICFTGCFGSQYKESGGLVFLYMW